MTARTVAAADAAALFAGLAHTPHQHFTLYFYAALLRVLEHSTAHFGTADAADERLPFLAGYFEEMAARGLDSMSFADAHARWRAGIEAWERAAPARLPLTVLRHAAGLDHDDLTLLAQIGLPDEDPRLGFVFDALHGNTGERRASLGLLASCWQQDPAFDARASAHRLLSLGLIEETAGALPALRPCTATWDAVRGAAVAPPIEWAHYQPAAALHDLAELVLPPALRAQCERLPAVLAQGAASAVIVRGARHNGRATIAGAIARAMGKGTLHVTMPDAQDARWRSAAALACMLDAVIVTRADPAPAESVELPELSDDMTRLFVTIGSAGAVAGTLAERSITLHVPVPDRSARDELWRLALGDDAAGLPFRRMASGSIVRAARVARAAGDVIDELALRAAVRTLERPGLETLARRIDAPADAALLAVSEQTAVELQTLESRCRQRERLAAHVGAALSDLRPGVRALFKGPSGTGKTLAARLLAQSLGMDLYRVDLAAVVNKYIGETEKNLERVFAAAEELDVLLLLDEGDALLTQRTGVQSANDRYANLETNYLLQRLESFDGILLVTTNAGDRIDSAFQRRMDAIIDFALPDAAERWEIWRLHLPHDHAIGYDVLQDVAHRCVLSGGHIRNVALHAALLALEENATLGTRHLENAIARHYRRQGAVSPLRPRAAPH